MATGETEKIKVKPLSYKKKEEKKEKICTSEHKPRLNDGCSQ